jgi:hypothetical protein
VFHSNGCFGLQDIKEYFKGLCHRAHIFQKRNSKLILNLVEEDQIVQYVIGMANFEHPINITLMKLKVAKACQ